MAAASKGNEKGFMQDMLATLTTKPRWSIHDSSGLEREGELSIENMTFKALRKMGLIDQLHAAAADAYDRSMSLG